MEQVFDSGSRHWESRLSFSPAGGETKLQRALTAVGITGVVWKFQQSAWLCIYCGFRLISRPRRRQVQVILYVPVNRASESKAAADSGFQGFPLVGVIHKRVPMDPLVRPPRRSNKLTISRNRNSVRPHAQCINLKHEVIFTLL